MLRRLLHSATVLAATIVAYQAYVLLAVPLLEPPLAMRNQTAGQEDGFSKINESVTRYQKLLAAYFPAGHWSLVQPPKVVENETGTVMFVLDDYKRHDDGRVELSHFAFLMFPSGRQQSAAPRDAVILEAPEGAELQFDKSFRPERGQIGQIVRGKFPGRITIHSDMKAEGPEDDLWIETRDLEMNSKLLRTSADVRFRLGPNIGSGKEMEIRLLEDEAAKAGGSGLQIAGVDSLEILREVRLRVFVATDSLLPGDKTGSHAPRGNPLPGRSRGEEGSATQSVADVRSHAERGNEHAGRGNEQGERGTESKGSLAAFTDPTQPPIDVTCTGPFHFDFLRYVASFDQNVEAWQVNPNGPSDQISCDRLDFHFARKEDADKLSPRAKFDPGQRQRDDIRWLEPDQIVAEGYPVVIVSPSREAEVRGGRVQLKLRERRMAVTGGDDVLVAYGPNQLRAPTIQYQHPAADADTKIGSFRADGPGTLRYIADPTKPDQVFYAAWQASVQLNRFNGQPRLTLAGRPQLTAAGAGRLTADQINVYLRELDSAGKTDAAAPSTISLNGQGGGKVEILPDRMNAVGQVEIDSPELLARTRELTAEFHVEAPEATADDSTTGAQSPGGGLAALNFGGTGGQPQRAYQVVSDAMHLDVALRGKRAAPTTLACNGNVAFRELPSAANNQQPMEVRGGQLVADNLDAAAHITIRGAAPNDPPDSQSAQILARGMTFESTEVHLDQGQNRLWSDGPGTATMVLQGDLLNTAAAPGAAAGPPTTVHVHWQGGVAFDGRHIAFQRNVRVEAPDDWLRCDELIGKLSSPVDFRGRVDQDAIELAEVECRGNVVMDHKSRDENGLTSHERFELIRLAINTLNGAISGDGPGTIRSTHLADQANAFGGLSASRGEGTDAQRWSAPGVPANTRGGGPPGSQANSNLQFLRVAFDGGLVGNFRTREIEFRRRVRTVYGPVDSWEQELPLDSLAALPPDTFTLNSDRLRINENPLAARAPAGGGAQIAGKSIGKLIMVAQDNVRINGQSPGKGEFTATADRIAYDQDKEQLMLEGTDRAPATLYHQQQIGGQFVKNAARKIQYNRLSGQVEQDGVHLFEFTPGNSADPQNARGPAAPLR